MARPKNAERSKSFTIRVSHNLFVGMEAMRHVKGLTQKEAVETAIQNWLLNQGNSVLQKPQKLPGEDVLG